MVDNPDPSRHEPKPSGNSAEYLRARLEAEGFHQLIAAIDRGELTVYGAACAAGIRKRPPVSGYGSDNMAKVRAVAVARAIGELPPLISSRTNGRPKHSIAPAPQTGMPDLAAALAECEAMRAPRAAQPIIDVAELSHPASSRERLAVEKCPNRPLSRFAVTSRAQAVSILEPLPRCMKYSPSTSARAKATRASPGLCSHMHVAGGYFSTWIRKR